MEEKNIIITTLDLKEDYEILDSLYVSERMNRLNSKEDYINQVFSKLKVRLREQCKKIGGDAVIGCHIFCFDYLFSINGTAVKIKSKS